jgi:hypothetical protein
LARLFVTVALLTATVLVALGAPPPASAVTVRASADASVSADRPKQRDRAKAPLRLGGPRRWRVLLSFRVPAGVAPVGQATLRVWASAGRCSACRRGAWPPAGPGGRAV